eukprot:403332837
MRSSSNQQRQTLNNNIGRVGGPRPQNSSSIRSSNIAANQVRPNNLQPRQAPGNNNGNATRPIVNTQRFPAPQNQRQNNNVQPPPQMRGMMRQAPQRPPPNLRAVRPQPFQHHFLQNQNPIAQNNFANAFSSVQNLISAYDEVGRSNLEDLTRRGPATLARNLYTFIEQRDYDRFSVLMGTFEQAILDYWNQRKLKEGQGINNQNTRKVRDCECDDQNCGCVDEPDYGLQNPYQFISKVCVQQQMLPYGCGVCTFALKHALKHQDIRYVKRLIENSFLNSVDERKSFPIDQIFKLQSNTHFIELIETMIQSGFDIMTDYDQSVPSLFMTFFTSPSINIERMTFILKQVKQEIPQEVREKILKYLSENQNLDQNLKLQLFENLGQKLFIDKSKCFLYTFYRLKQKQEDFEKSGGEQSLQGKAKQLVRLKEHILREIVKYL